ncbi:hypothetical protein [Candidatus Bodocaedibacter vickermanii]|uniref:Uncharacterized protein n=1 Tax=Candidatus Bodocaedibacter vickermanii TaxID=2741701 RepID=A0A7L9RS98_9PROT|nr:hypothetical protein CPBP_00173 [Candidatus Paracaedibacteraceae bacterium 'Lake Konstanz']
MTIKSLFLAMGIIVSNLSAADALGEDAMDPNADLNLLIAAYSASANDQTMMALRLYVHSLQAEISHLINCGKITEATVKAESAIALLNPLFKSMSEEQHERLGSKELKNIKIFIHMYIPNM